MQTGAKLQVKVMTVYGHRILYLRMITCHEGLWRCSRGARSEASDFPQGGIRRSLIYLMVPFKGQG